MKEDQLPENNRIAFDAFLRWKADLEEKEGLSLGDAQEDWEPSWTCFLAGWRSCGDTF